jgi:hypothetical protein
VRWRFKASRGRSDEGAEPRILLRAEGDQEPQLFNVTQSVSGEPHLPGFEVAVNDVFTR